MLTVESLILALVALAEASKTLLVIRVSVKRLPSLEMSLS